MNVQMFIVPRHIDGSELELGLETLRGTDDFPFPRDEIGFPDNHVFLDGTAVSGIAGIKEPPTIVAHQEILILP